MLVLCLGIEAGGHGNASAPPLLNLLPETITYFRNTNKVIPTLGAGGIVIESQIAGVLALGGSGAVLGTRFLCTSEARYTPTQKAALCAARGAAVAI